MKGDIRISKKSALFIAGVISFFAMADYVSVISSNNVEYISDTKEEVMTVGSVVLRMDTVNPADIYGGTWQLITSDASLSFGDGTAQNGTPYGSNTPVVPLVQHSHTINHDHPSVSTNTNSHSHGLGNTTSQQGTWAKWNNGNGSYGVHSSGGYANKSLSTNSSSHSHTVNLPNFTGNSGNAGVANATLDVRGQRIDINVWQRIL